MSAVTTVKTTKNGKKNKKHTEPKFRKTNKTQEQKKWDVTNWFRILIPADRIRRGNGWTFCFLPNGGTTNWLFYIQIKDPVASRKTWNSAPENRTKISSMTLALLHGIIKVTLKLEHLIELELFVKIARRRLRQKPLEDVCLPKWNAMDRPPQIKTQRLTADRKKTEEWNNS